MRTRAVRLHGKNDLRLDEFELPEIADDEILVKVVTDSVCMSTYKTALQGADHKYVPADVAEHPGVMGHELAGDIVKVGSHWEGVYTPGTRFTVQPALRPERTCTPGYSCEFFGGDATYAIVPAEVMEFGCLLEYKGDAYYQASLAEPFSCNIGAFNSSFHTRESGREHVMGIRTGGKLALVGAAGPMGMGGLAYALRGHYRPSLVVLADINQERLDRAARIFPPERILAEEGIELHFVNTGATDNAHALLMDITDGTGYDDVFCYAPIPSVIETCGNVLAPDGCLNFFSGPIDKHLSAPINFYNVHYNALHVVGTSGGNLDEMVEFLDLAEKRRIDPSFMVTHIGGLNAAIDTTLNLPSIPGGKKLIYTHLDLPLIALDDLRGMGAGDVRFAELADIVDAHDGLWSPEAERYLLSHWEETC